MKMEFVIDIFECVLFGAICFFLGIVFALVFRIKRIDWMPGMKDVQNALWNEMGEKWK